MKQEELFRLIEKKYTPKNTQLKNNSKVIIAFSGVPGSGKTYLSKLLEKEFRAVRFRSDIIRNIINKFPEEYFEEINPNLEKIFGIKDISKLKEYLYDEISIKKESLIANYIDNFFQNYSYKNTFVIYDGSIDRRYEYVKKVAEESGFRMFTIKLPLDKEVIRKRVIQRGEGDMTFFDTNFPRWENDYKKLGKKIRPEFEFNNNLEKLIKKINSFLT